MAVTLDLSSDDVGFLADHLARYIASLDDELVHSDTREIQHALAADVERLRRVRERLAAAR
jgi:hypothetical protein